MTYRSVGWRPLFLTSRTRLRHSFRTVKAMSPEPAPSPDAPPPAAAPPPATPSGPQAIEFADVHEDGRVELAHVVPERRGREPATHGHGCARDQRRADGTWRDAAIFSVIAEEWPEVKAGLEARLEDWGERPVLYRSVPSA